MTMKLRLIKAARVRAIAKSSGKRVSKAYLLMLDDKCCRMLARAIETHNGGRKTIDETVGCLSL